MCKFTTILFFLLLSFSAQALEDFSIQLQWLNQFQFAGYYIAQEKGFYQESGLDVSIQPFQQSKPPVDEVLSDNAQYGVGRSTLLVDRSNGRKIILLKSIFQLSPTILLAKKDNGIKTLQDIKNKRVMVTQDMLFNVNFRVMLTANGLDFDNDLIHQPHSLDINDLVLENTDLMMSYISNEPYALDALGIESVYFSPSDYGFEFYDDILFTSESEMKRHPERVKKFVEASLQGWQWAFDNIEETAQIIFDKYNEQEKTLEALIYEGKALKKLAYHDQLPLGDINIDKLKTIYETYKTMGLVKAPLDFQNLVYNDSPLSEKIQFFMTNQVENGLLFKAFILLAVLLLSFGFWNIALNRRVESEIQKRLQQESLIFQQNRLITMGEMIANIAHQWRQPLAIINSTVLNIDQASQHNKLNQKTLDTKLSIIESNTAYMSQVIDDFSNYLCSSTAEQKFSINEAIEKTIQLAEPAFQKANIKITFFQTENIDITGPESELIQSIMTILNNARNALETKSGDRLVKVSLTNVNKKTVITIKNNGTVIEKRDLNRIFDPYFSTVNSLSRGLGLYIANRIITDKFNGTIKAHNDNGVVFTIKLNEKP